MCPKYQTLTNYQQKHKNINDIIKSPKIKNIHKLFVYYYSLNLLISSLSFNIGILDIIEIMHSKVLNPQFIIIKRYIIFPTISFFESIENILSR